MAAEGDMHLLNMFFISAVVSSPHCDSASIGASFTRALDSLDFDSFKCERPVPMTPSSSTVIINVEDDNDDEPTPVEEGPLPKSQPQKAGPRTHLLFAEDNTPAFRFAQEVAGEIGVQFEQEELSMKVFYPAAQKLVFRVR